MKHELVFINCFKRCENSCCDFRLSKNILAQHGISRFTISCWVSLHQNNSQCSPSHSQRHGQFNVSVSLSLSVSCTRTAEKVFCALEKPFMRCKFQSIRNKYLKIDGFNITSSQTAENMGHCGKYTLGKSLFFPKCIFHSAPYFLQSDWK